MNKKTISQLVKNVLKANNELNLALSNLTIRASELFGSGIVADICNGDEIEFRKEGDDFHQEITIEELLELEKNILTMNKELEEWIEQNNPFLANKSTAEILKNHPMSLAWTAGAKSMAEHLESQPPTKEFSEKFLRIAEIWTGGKLNPAIVDWVMKHWNDDV